MSDEFVDPGEPGDLSLRAKDLLNKPCLIRPNVVLHNGKGKDDGGNDTTYTFVSCDVWVLDRAGIVESGTGVQVSWKRAMPQLTDRIGKFVAATPRRQDDNSVILEAFTEGGKEVARAAIKEILTETPSAQPADEFSDAPFEDEII